MLIGITIEGSAGAPTLDERFARARAVAGRGFAAAWTGEPLNPDPLALAGQALTVQAATGSVSALAQARGRSSRTLSAQGT